MRPAPAALLRALPLLRCPLCAGPLDPTGTGVVCPAGHSVDRARQGYLALLGPRGRRFPGDTVEQVEARERVLASGLLDPVVSAAAEAVANAVPDGTARPVVLEAGAGTGVYLGAALDRLAARGSEPLGIGTELSVPAVRRLARAHPAAAAVVADTWQPLPLVDRSVDVVLVVFAPRNPAEFARVLRPGGALVVVTPGPGHLEPLRGRLGLLGVPADKERHLAGELGSGWTHVASTSVETTARPDPTTAVDLALMGPSGVHLDRAAADTALEAAGGDATVTLDVGVHTHRPG